MPDFPSESPEPLPGDNSPQSRESELSVSDQSAPVPPRRFHPPLPRPGLPLAILIVLGIPLVHLAMTLGYVVVIDRSLLTHAGTGAPLTEQLTAKQLINLLAFDQGMFVCLAFLGTWLIFRQRFGRVIPMNLPPTRHVVLLFLLVVPLAVMDGFLAQQVIDIGETVFGVTPSQGDLPELLDGITKEASVGFLLIVLAVAPALGEELVFRGVIGRGLIARKGLFWGIFWTSVLFSIVHGNPVQGVGVFFVGVMCHVAYVATRSLAAPILLHFLNNMLPVFALKNLADQEALGSVAAAEQVASNLPPWMALAAAICVAVLGCLLWKSRVQFLDADGAVLDQFPPSVEPPPEAAWAECRRVPAYWIPLACGSYILFLVSGSLAMPA